MNNNLIIAIYSHPEYYPPTLNAIEQLSVYYKKIIVVHRNIEGFDWEYPSNVQLISVCKKYHVRETEKASVFKKTYWFLRYTLLLFYMIRKIKPDTVILYDSMPILSWRIIHKLIPIPHILWYHNHDVTGEKYFKKLSLSHWAAKSEKWVFARLNIFSLPALERKVYFPMNKLKGAFFFIPNYPSIKVFDRISILTKKRSNSLRILFQGSIGPMHGLEEIITILKHSVTDKKLTLVLKGFISDSYKKELQVLAEKYGVGNALLFLPPSGYREVIENAQSCHIGIGIHKKTDIMNQTLGTASNKIYEYAASGLPVLLFNNEHFRGSLGKREWVFFTDTSKESFLTCFELIEKKYKTLSEKATEDFKKHLNFELVFSPVLKYLLLQANKSRHSIAITI